MVGEGEGERSGWSERLLQDVLCILSPLFCSLLVLDAMFRQCVCQGDAVHVRATMSLPTGVRWRAADTSGARPHVSPDRR